jgi:hypothetical protein
MRSVIDYDTNISFPVSKTSCEFRTDGTYIVRPENRNEEIQNSWELIDHNNYLRIGNNTFHINFLSHKLLALQYGNMVIYYVPQGK